MPRSEESNSPSTEREYTVTWVIQVDAPTPEEAALYADRILHDSHPDEWVYVVEDEQGNKSTHNGNHKETTDDQSPAASDANGGA